MYIDIHINGDLRKRWKISHEHLPDIPGATWQENVEARQLVVEKYLRQFKSFVAPHFDGHPDVMYSISFESKMNSEVEVLPIVDIEIKEV